MQNNHDGSSGSTAIVSKQDEDICHLGLEIFAKSYLTTRPIVTVEGGYIALPEQRSLARNARIGS